MDAVIAALLSELDNIFTVNIGNDVFALLLTGFCESKHSATSRQMGSLELLLPG